MDRKTIRRLLAVTGALVLVPATAGAQEGAIEDRAEDPPVEVTTQQEQTDTEQGSGSEAEATALEIEGVVTIGQTSGTTEDGSGESSATAVELGGETVAGGEQTEPGTNEGELVGTGETPLGEVSVAPHSATVEDDGSTQSSAALAEVTVVDRDTLHLAVLGSETQTSADGASGHSDGARVVAGGEEGLDLHVLHASANSEGESGAAAVVNDQPVVSDEQTGGALCPLDAAPVVIADIVCATAAEGTAAAGVLDAELLDGALPLAGSTTNVSAAPADADDDAAPAPGDAEAPADAAPPAEDGTLPLTGGSIFALLGIAAGSVGAGEYLRRRGR